MGRKNEYTIRVDTIIGERIHELRIARGLSRQQIAAKVGVTHQQFQKYEKGTNRISAGRLASIAKALKKPVAYFFKDVEQEQDKFQTQHQRMCIEISRNFMKIKDPSHQQAVNHLIKTLIKD